MKFVNYDCTAGILFYRYYFFIGIIIFLFSNTFLNPATLENTGWNFDYEKNGIRLFVGNNIEEDLTGYKAETVIGDVTPGQVIDYIMNFDNYCIIFPKTLIFEPVEKINDNEYKIYAAINFFPAKNRDYFINLKTYQKDGKHIIEWRPSEKSDNYLHMKNKNYIHVEKVYGRWVVEAIDHNNIKVSAEFANDWQISISIPMVTSIEKQAAVNAVKDLKKYIKKKRDKNKNG